MRIHKTGTTMTGQTPASEIPLQLVAADVYVALENLTVRLLIELAGLTSANDKVITLVPTIQDSSGDPKLAFINWSSSSYTIPAGNTEAMIYSEPFSLAKPLIESDADQFRCGLTGTNCGTGASISVRMVVVEENVEYVEGATPMATSDVTNAVQERKTY